MKDAIKEVRDAIAPELPNMMVVAVDSPEQYVDYQGLTVAQSINGLIHDITSLIGCTEQVIKENIDLMADKDIDTLKKIVSGAKADMLSLQEMSSTYDDIDVDKSAAKSLKKLLKGSK